MSTEHLLSDMGAVLEALMGTEDEPRQEAERHLRRLTVEQPAEIMLVLAQIGAQGVGGFQLDHRLLSLILLKRLAFKALPGLFLNSTSQLATAPFDIVRETTRTRIETVLTAGLKDEMDVRMRKGLGNCAAGWAQESSKRHRPLLPLPPVLLELTTSPHPFHRFTPFQLLDMTPTLLVDSVSDPLPAPQLAHILLAGVNDPSVDVRVEALKAVRSVLMEGVTGKEREEIGPQLIYEAFQSLPKLPMNLLSHALVPLVDLASLHPHLYVPSLSTILPGLLSMVSPPGLIQTHQFSPYPPSGMDYEAWEEIANPATEILLSLAELRSHQVQAWEDGRAGKELVGLLIGRQSVSFDLDCQDWLEASNLDEEDEDYPVFAEEALDRLGIALGGTTILPALSAQVQSLLQQDDWRCRYCALVAIAAVAEGCLEELQPRIRDVLAIISPTAKDPHPRVRYAFLQCLGQLCSDCEGTMQTQYANDVLQVCLGLLQDPVTRVRAHSSACLTNFFQDVELEAFATYLDPLVRSLLSQFQAGPLYMQEQVLATISNIALAALEAFAPYYRDLMDLLLHTLSIATDERQQKLQGRAMECASLTGSAVGKAMFAIDAVKLARLMIGVQNSLTSDDKRSLYLMDAWTSLCQTLGDDFEPFLPVVIPPLLESAAYSPPNPMRVSEVSPKAFVAYHILCHGPLEDTVNKPSRAFPQPSGSGTALTNRTIHSPLLRILACIALSSFEDSPTDVEDSLVASNTAEVDEKVQAFENLTLYAFTMRGKFQPWLLRAMELSLEGLVCVYSEGVREAAAFLVPGLLQVAKDAGVWNDKPSNLIEVFQRVINAITKENDPAFLALLYKSFTDSLHVIALPLPPNLSTQLLNSTTAHLNAIHTARVDREAQAPYMDEGDREIFMEDQENEDSALDQIGAALEMVLRYDHASATAGDSGSTGGRASGMESGVSLREQVKKIEGIRTATRLRGLKADDHDE